MQNRTPDTQSNNVNQKTPVPGMDSNNKRAEGMNEDREMQGGKGGSQQGDRSRTGTQQQGGGQGQGTDNTQQRQ